MTHTLNEAAKTVEEEIGHLPFGPSLLTIFVFTELARLGGIDQEMSARIAIAAGEEAKERMKVRNGVKL